MQRDINSFPIPPSFRVKLNSAGFNSVADVLELKPSELSKELNISKEDALEVIRAFKSGASSLVQEKSHIHDKGLPKDSSQRTGASDAASSSKHPVTDKKSGGGGDGKRTATAFEMLQKEQSLPPIITFCEELDEMLGGGVPMCKITEICGAPGVGKTQTCIQLSVDVQIPAILGGVEGEAVYIDTEGSFIPQRAWDIAQAATEHCHTMAGTKDQAAKLREFTTEKILSGIHYFRCHNHVELLALVNLLPDFLSNNPKVKLITVDSIAFHFRHDFDDMSLRTRLLNGLAQNLIRIATQYSLAVVLTNQMTTKIVEGSSHLVPALGESWGHACTIRIILYWKQAQRYANLYKSPSKQEATVPYQITQAGVRSVSRHSCDSGTHHSTHDEAGDNTRTREEETLTNHHDNQDGGIDNPRKRPRSADTVT